MSEDNKTYYQVDKFIGRREVQGQVEYKIHWQGYSTKYDTWEPEYNLNHCKELIDEYMEKQDNKKRRRSRKPPKPPAVNGSAVLLSSDDEEVVTPVKKKIGRPRKTQQVSSSPVNIMMTRSRSSASPMPNTKKPTTVTTTEVAKTYDLRSTSIRVLGISDDDESHPREEESILVIEKRKMRQSIGSGINTRMSLSESKFRKKIEDINRGVTSVAQKISSTPYAEDADAVSSSSGSKVLAKTRLTFDNSHLENTLQDVGGRATLTSTTTTTEQSSFIPPSTRLPPPIAEADMPPNTFRAVPEQESVKNKRVSDWLQIGWREFLLAAFVTTVSSIGYVCYTTDYCGYC